MKKYTPSEIESKWQKVWNDTRLYEVSEDQSKQKMYATPMLPYPSGAGLHVGHVRNYSIADAVARFYRQQGYNVMSNMGWDSFGLPAENYAIKTGTPPAESTAGNIANFKHQLKRLGISYAWERELNTSDPEYYKWTQWLFTQFFNDDLAYQAENLQWWCTQCKTVLANEQVVNDKCWRHDGADDPLVEKRRTKQWFFKITEYGDSLLEQLDTIDWPSSITTQQRNWIGRSVGAEVVFNVADSDQTITVFTTRIDTLYGATFMVLAPESQLIDEIVTKEQSKAVSDYVISSTRKTDIERSDDGKEKTGVFTGAYAINPATKEKMPIWVGDFVLGGYGTGAIMAVPGHDQRDNDFAAKFDLPIIPVVANVHEDTLRPVVEDMPIEDRVAVQTIVKHPEKDLYLCLKLKGWEEETYSLPIGGVDEGEDAQTAARRECVEETGFTDIGELTEVAAPYFALFHHDFKKLNRRAYITTFTATLNSLKQQEVSEEEKQKHTLDWVTIDELSKKLHGQGVQNVVDHFRGGGGATTGEGVLINSGDYNGMSTSEAREKMTADLAKQNIAQEKVNYKMRDWLISRQRYWGAPIPIIHCDDCGAVAVPEKDLPVVLPEVEDFAPTGEATSVLATVDEWVNVPCPDCGKNAKRETDTMDGYVCSSWYMYRYCDAGNDEMAWDPEKVNYWFPVDYYFGGDHAVAHLLYFRFWNHYFAEKGLIAKDKIEPVKSLVYNGYINAEDGSKMSKSKGNVVDPLDIIDSGYGADALRMYELFVGPYDQDVVWNPNGVPGTYRFLQRVWSLAQELLELEESPTTADGDELYVLEATVHKTIKKVTEDLQKHRFNTAIAACMELVNSLNKLKETTPLASAYAEWRVAVAQLMQLLAPFAPHIAEELFSELGFEESIHTSGWPKWDESKIKDDLMTVAVQVNGKLRGEVVVAAEAQKEEILALAAAEENVVNFTSAGTVVKSIYVPGKIVNFVVK